jgi:hypothetical protein
MNKPRLSIRISTVGQDLLKQLARTLGLTQTGAIEVSVREKAISLGLKPHPGAEPAREEVASHEPVC